MGKISFVINTLNEELNIARALKSVKDIADEIIIVDMHSDDKTVEVASKFGAKVYTHKKTNYVEPARNFAISKATSDWILLLDADEEISPTLCELLLKIVKNPKADYYRIPRKNIIFGKWIQNAMWWPDHNIRFFKNGFVTWSEIIHSVPTTSGKGADVEAKESNAIIHHHYDTIDQYLEKLSRYTTAQSDALIEKKYDFSWKDIVTKPASEFIRRFYQSSGYKDGLHGLVLSLLQAFSEFVVYIKVWQHEKFISKNLSLSDFENEFKNLGSEKNYWSADANYKEYKSLGYRIKRKFKLP